MEHKCDHAKAAEHKGSLIVVCQACGETVLPLAYIKIGIRTYPSGCVQPWFNIVEPKPLRSERAGIPNE
jgi:hypothetical protein